MLKIRKLFTTILAWVLISPSFAGDHQKYMTISIWGIKRGMTATEAEDVIRTNLSANDISKSRYQGSALIKNISATFTDGRSIRATLGTKDQKVEDIYAYYQGSSYKNNLQPSDLKELPKPDFSRETTIDLIYGWGGKRLVDGDLQPSPGSEGTLLVTHRKGHSIGISLEGKSN